MLDVAQGDSAVKPLISPILATHSGPRERIYRVLLSAPDRAWTVAELADHVPDVSVEAVRTTLYLLLGDRLVEPVARQRALTLQLTQRGHETVEQIAGRWATSGQSTRVES